MKILYSLRCCSDEGEIDFCFSRTFDAHQEVQTIFTEHGMNNTRRNDFSRVVLLFLALCTIFFVFPHRSFSQVAGVSDASSLESEIDKVRQEARASPTNRQNFQRRFMFLQEWVKVLFQRGMDVSAAYPKGTGAEIERLIRNNQIDGAALMIDRYYSALEALVSEKTSLSNTEPARRGSRAQQDKASPSPAPVDRATPDRPQIDSPFGINGFYVPKMVVQVLQLSGIREVIQKLENQTVPRYLELGVRWGRIHPAAFGSFSWDNVDGDKDGLNLDFSSLDSYVKLAQKHNISILPSLSPESNWLQSSRYVPLNLEAYRSYVKQTVERYDGDGVNDMPGLKFPVKYWQLDNEADLRHRVRGSGFESPADYYQVLKVTYEGVKESDTTALVMVNVAGLGQGLEKSSIDYIRDLMALGAKNYFDVFSYHVYPEAYDTVVFQKYQRDIQALIGNKAVWITETAISDQPDSQAQAGWLVKNYVFHLANGVEKIFWLDLSDGSPRTPDRLARHGGLIAFEGTKKPSYYTYKKLVEVLEGSDWNGIQIIRESDGIYIYKFTKKGKPVWVAWNDSKEPKGMRIRLDRDTKAVKITEAVPKFESGKEMINYNGAFQEITRKDLLESYPPQLYLELGSVPVFVEGK